MCPLTFKPKKEKLSRFVYDSGLGVAAVLEDKPNTPPPQTKAADSAAGGGAADSLSQP